MKFIPGILLLGAVAGITACSGPGQKRPAPALSQDFSTHITQDGSKMFVFTLSMQRPERQGGKSGMRPPARGERKGGGGRKDRSDELEKMTTALLDQKLETSGYCREGYMVLERFAEQGKSRIRGECKETATDADREHFSGAVAIPVKYAG
ncbi:lipoprotein [Maricurvus nonylphenolicus]|uniref:hypothetical protein n=1 Tax=Maricurvus nonylphenolicus TaxID=1008307 RepID=UPI0036F3F511